MAIFHLHMQVIGRGKGSSKMVNGKVSSKSAIAAPQVYLIKLGEKLNAERQELMNINHDQAILCAKYKESLEEITKAFGEVQAAQEEKTKDFDDKLFILDKISTEIRMLVKSVNPKEGIEVMQKYNELVTEFSKNLRDLQTGLASAKTQAVAVGFDNITNAPTVVPTSVQQILESPSAFIGNMASFFYYDLFAWQNRREPCLALSIAAQEYPTSGRAQVLHIGIGYSDGMGRAVQSKVKVEGGLAWHYDSAASTITEITSDERWLTSGAVVYDNKGNTIKAYEPYYSDTAGFISPDTILAQLVKVDSRFGITPIMHYDPLNRVYKVTTPKGFITRSAWTPGEQTSYDPNDAFDASIPYCLDNIGTNLDPTARYYDATLPASARTSVAALQSYFGITDFIDTPGKVINDNLGRAIIGQTIRKPALDPVANPNGEVLSTYCTYDIEGNLLTTSDPRLGQLATPIASFTNTYGFGNMVLKVDSVDAGKKWILSNIFGNPIYSCDSRKIVVTSTYDKLHRPVCQHASPRQQLQMIR